MENTNVMDTTVVSTFNFEDQQVNVFTEEGNPWFIGKQVATILDYSDTDQALRKHVDKEDKKTFTYAEVQTRQIDGFTSPRGLIIINESGLYSLIMGSKLPSAKKFQRWVTSEVLPSIRKTGSYSAKPMTLAEQFMAQAKINLEHERRMLALQEADKQQASRLTAVEQKLIHPIAGVLRKEEEHDIKLKDHEERIIDIEHMFRDEGPTEEIICLIKDVVNNCNYSYDNAYKGFYTFLRKQGIDVYARQANLKRRAERAGWTKSQVKQISVLDAIKRSPDTWDKIRSAIALVRENLDMED